MKKTLLTCMAVLAVLAISSSVSAITCTVDSRPAATLLIPYFQATFNADGTFLSGPSALDTLVTIGNASSALMIAHVNVFNDRSELVLDFNVALTGFDVQSWSMASVLRGNLPSTGFFSGSPAALRDACQRNCAVPGAGAGGCVVSGNFAGIYPTSATRGFIRINPASPATGLDNSRAQTNYPPGPFPPSFLFDVLDSLDVTLDTRACLGGTDGAITNPIHGYLTIDHANYCNLSSPRDQVYYNNDAIGMENNLWGDYIFTSGAGIGTVGFPAVAIEAQSTGTPGSLVTSSTFADAGAPINVRTFYRRYYLTDTLCAAANCAGFTSNPWNQGVGDQREPLGLKYAARWFNTTAVTSSFNVWRASSAPGNTPLSPGTDLVDLLGPTVGGVLRCTSIEPVVTLNFYDEDENQTTTGGCPSPCISPSFNFPLETQRTNITNFSGALPVAPAGWVSMAFFNGSAPNGGVLDQAYVTYDFQGPVAFLSAGIPASQLDPSTCNPLGVGFPGPAPGGVNVITPTIPSIAGTGP